MHTLSEHIAQIGRLKERPEFLHVQKVGKRWTAKNLSLQIAPNNLEFARFGLTVSKKIFKQAVKRNRIRRRLRAVAYEVIADQGISGYDLVVIGRAEALNCEYADLLKDLNWCLRRLEITE